MTLFGVCSVRNEAEVLPRLLQHYIYEGVQHFWISDGGSDDGTLDILHEHDMVTVVDELAPYHQANEMNHLAQLAMNREESCWVIPFDADEYFRTPDLTPIATYLGTLVEGQTAVHCPVYMHKTWEDRAVDHKAQGKVVFMPAAGGQLQWGQHGLNDHAGETVPHTIEAREWQYRSYEHFCDKIQKSKDLYARAVIPLQYGGHMRSLMECDDPKARYDQIMAFETVRDPIRP